MKENKKIILKKITNGLCFTLAAGLLACSGETATGVEETTAIAETEEVVTADTWDNNEFNSTFASTNYYEDWDLNDDNLLDENEYYGGFYSTWDVNDDDRLDENEWNTAVNDWGLENETWAEWDTTGDGVLEDNEFRTGFADSGWYDSWDADNDNFLGEREYTDGVFGLWDDNADGMLDDNEYGAYNTYFGV